MQIREQGKKVQLIRSPYDSEKKRCIQKLAHSFPRKWAYLSANLDEYLSADQILDLSDDEKKELTAWLSERSDKNLAETRKYSIDSAPRSTSQLADNISSEVVELTENEAIRVWDALDKLAKAMRKAGYKKPAKPAKPAVQVQSSEQSSLTL